MRLPEFSVKQPVATLMFFLAIILIGSVSLFKLSIDMFPELELPVVSILTSWSGASASDIETEVTQNIENQVTAVSNLDSLMSKSIDNLSAVMCKFDWGTGLDVATNDIRDALELAKRDLPEDVDPPFLYKFSTAEAPIMFMTIGGDLSWPRLYHIADKKIADEIRRIPGVGAIDIYGGLRRRINVYFDLKKIEGFHISIHEINRILALKNMNIPAGTIKTGDKEYFVRVPARYKTIDEIRNTVVGYYQNRTIYLKDIASVKDDYKPQELNGWADGKKALVLVLKKQVGANTVAIISKIKQRLEEIKKNIPSDVEIIISMDNSESILNSIENLCYTLGWGLFFVVLVTIVFLRRLRTAIIITLTIPFSLTISLILLYLGGYTINLVSLMAMAIASGMVVDNGIVVLENIIRHIEEGGRPKTSAVFGASEMGMAITASTMTTVVVFTPLMFITGLSGIIFKQLAFVISVTLLASLFTALTMTPMLSSRWIIYTPKRLRAREGFLGKFYSLTEDWFEAIENGYSRLLIWALHYRKTILVLVITVFLSSLSLIPYLSTSFVPKVDSGDLNVTFRLAEGTRIEETNRVVESIFKIMEEVVLPEESRHSFGFDGQTEKGIGVALGFDQGPNVGQVGFKLVDSDKRSRSAVEIANLLRDEIEKIPGITQLKVVAGDPIGSIIMGGGKPISIEIQGAELDENLAFAKDVEGKLKQIPGMVDVSVSQKDPRPELWVEIDRKKASSLGLSTSVIAFTLRNYFYGVDATQFWDGGEIFDICTRFKDADKDKFKTLLNSPIFTPDGRAIKIKNVAKIVRGEGPIEIERKNRQKLVKVEGDIYGRSLGEIKGDIRRVLNNMGVPQGLSIYFGGEVEEQEKTFRDFSLLFSLGVVLVYMVMAALYGNFRDPLIIMFSIPFAVTGVVYIFFLTGVTLGMMSALGVVMLVGIVVNNAIVLLDYTHLLQKRGEPLFEAVINAGKARLRPVLMTTFTTFFAMVPMATSSMVGAEVWNPIGITMLGGLSVSAIITLIIIPTVYYMFEKRKMGMEA
ncbi:MAG: efflux RND transporter permease subunit [Thermodesulfobacteriota bacterium]|nr:efflux RND transporter permease subunit [Thermodesulfobacteriota bacterium]